MRWFKAGTCTVFPLITLLPKAKIAAPFLLRIKPEMHFRHDQFINPWHEPVRPFGLHIGKSGKYISSSSRQCSSSIFQKSFGSPLYLCRKNKEKWAE
jgi:hypothetical protein